MRKFIGAAGLILFAGAAVAQAPGDDVGQDPGAAAQELSVLQSEIAIAKAKKQLRELKDDGSSAPGVGMGMPGQPPGMFGAMPAGAMPPTTSNAAPASVAAAPVHVPGIEDAKVVAIEAYDGQFLARISIDGSVIAVRRGDVLRGWRVVSIDAGTVLLAHGRRLHSIPIGGLQ